MKIKTVIIFLFSLASFYSYSQGNIRNVDFTFKNNLVIITYEISVSGECNNCNINASLNGENSNHISQKSITGDYENISSGHHKIKMEVTSDEDINGSFQVILSGSVTCYNRSHNIESSKSTFKLISITKSESTASVKEEKNNFSNTPNIKVDFTVTNNNVIINYDLINFSSDWYYDMDIKFVDDNNKVIQPNNLTGDFKKITSGKNKKIKWIVFDDREEFTGNFKVVISEKTSMYSTTPYPKSDIAANNGQTGQSDFKQVNISKNSKPLTQSVPKPIAPADLIVSNITFSDSKGNNNNLLDANENAEIKFTVTNKGKGDAYNLVAGTNEVNKIKGIQFSKEQPSGNLASGKEMTITIPVSGAMQLESGKADFEITIKEGNHFDADLFKISLQTHEIKHPQIAIVDNTFSNKEEGKIKLGESINLLLLIQNKGQGYASDITVSFKMPDNVFILSDSAISFKTLKPDEKKLINCEFVANKKYSGNTISVQVIITEGYKKYGENKMLSVSLEETLAKSQQVNINVQQENEIKITEGSLFSDVDKNIPENNSKHQNRFALIIGNEDYSSFQIGLNTEANVEFARNDAKTFKQYCIQTLGLPKENITFLIDATAGKMKQSIDKINKLIKNSDGKSEIIFYYAGHGLPDENSHEPYIIPVDVTGSDLLSAIKLSDVYHSLTEFTSERVTVFLDACFSGGGRNQGLVAARGVKVTPRADLLIGNIVVFSASSSSQTSLPYKEKQHGLFTYYLLKKLQDTKGDVTYSDLKNYLSSQIGLESVKINDKEQNPQINISSTINPATLEKWKMK